MKLLLGALALVLFSCGRTSQRLPSPIPQPVKKMEASLLCTKEWDALTRLLSEKKIPLNQITRLTLYQQVSGIKADVEYLDAGKKKQTFSGGIASLRSQ